MHHARRAIHVDLFTRAKSVMWECRLYIKYQGLQLPNKDTSQPYLEGISTGRSDVVSKSGEELVHFRIVVELTALVHEDIFTRTSRSVFLEEVSEPVDRRGFGDPCVAMFILEKWSVTRIQEVSPLRPI